MTYHMGDSCRWLLFFFSSRRRHTRFDCDWSSDVCSSDLDNLDHVSFSIVKARHAIPPRPVSGLDSKLDSLTLQRRVDFVYIVHFEVQLDRLPIQPASFL